MPCCLGIFALVFPRLALIAMWLSGYAGYAYDSRLWPVLGFFFMPYTACAYAIALNSAGGLHGMGLAILIVGVMLDAGSHGGSASGGRRYRKMHIHVER